MLPHGYEQPASIALLLGGALACFAGYRLFRIVLGIYGFILGAMIASSVVGVSNTTGMLLAAIIGGLVGSVVLVFAWFVGVSLVGAGIGVLIAHVVWTQVGRGDPPAIAHHRGGCCRCDRCDVRSEIRDCRRHRVRRRLDGRPGRGERLSRHEGGADPRCVGDRGVDLLSDLRPRHALGADRLGRPRPARHGDAAVDDGGEEEVSESNC